MTSETTAGGTGSGMETFHTPEPTLWDYVRVVSTRRWVVLSAFVIALVLAGLWVFTRTSIYRSRAILQVATNKAALAPSSGSSRREGMRQGPRTISWKRRCG